MSVVSVVPKDEVRDRYEIVEGRWYELQRDVEIVAEPSVVIIVTACQQLSQTIVHEDYGPDYGLKKGDWVACAVLISCGEEWLEREDWQIVYVPLSEYIGGRGKMFHPSVPERAKEEGIKQWRTYVKEIREGRLRVL